MLVGPLGKLQGCAFVGTGISPAQKQARSGIQSRLCEITGNYSKYFTLLYYEGKSKKVTVPHGVGFKCPSLAVCNLDYPPVLFNSV